MLPLYEKIFNLVFDSGVIPEAWVIGIICPVFKNKGDPRDPNNYRSITLVSCFGKVFTSILNRRLKLFDEEISLISPAQAGFRKFHSTVDNIFILQLLINLYLLKKKKLFCTFVDYSKAFDKVRRACLWTKMLKNNIRGKCFNVIKNMYSNIKSCVKKDCIYSQCFPCNIGVRQGENLSPFLSALFINDIEQFFEEHNIQTLTMVDEKCEELLDLYMKIYILLYADDTVLLSETYEGMQNMLNIFNDYCKLWKLEININKTKTIIFSSRRLKFTKI